ncbi:preprotein translocase subunit SecA [Anaerohalosphaera lusitana]|uniref:Protein translocase subunit SecA n=1 Tax=Anaerohalosphaera lusitana TaxID=1936003 RepID=A0A1U9NI31_9BACT|nr:preprotein translocase subunit SecA [Anaerohalosphaera lusitana]AQT67384.1 preprotein translocase subunit SecA [Anaerohalosphaera lusitana]
MPIAKISSALQKIFGSRNERVLKRHWRLAERVKELEPQFQQMSDGELSAQTQKFKDRLAAGERTEEILPEAFATIRETSDRHLGFRNALLDQYEFDASKLDGHTRKIYDELKAKVDEGADVHDLDVPVEFNAVIRELYPESRPPFRFRHFDVQVIGGHVLYEGSIAEMATGEGKTLVATLAAYVVHLTGQKVHVITVNDYLAKRDADWMRPVFAAMGLTVGAIQGDMDTSGAARREQYECDITYGTNNEFGFDYLRDNMKTSLDRMAQGPLEYSLIDEVDSILIDEARTPLIISGPAVDDVNRYRKADSVARELMRLQSGRMNLKSRADAAERKLANAQGEYSEAKKAKDDARMQKAQKVVDETQEEIQQLEAQVEQTTEYFEIEYDRKAVHLTHDGISAAQDIAGVGSFYTGSNIEWPHMLEQSLRAHVVFEREKDYVVKDNKVVIVDEFTGRLMEGRQWSDGLHQAVEAKEGVKIKEESQTLATITLQNFFKLYDQIAGMTGTAITEAGEFLSIYGLDVVVIPTNRPLVRDDRQDLIYKSMAEKFNAIVDEIYEVSSAGRPVLVGTISIEKSEAISRALTKKYNVDHEVLNAKQHAREAVIVEKAGCQHKRRDGKAVGNVTIATNMAGRGTDIKLGPGVAEIGGLHIVGTERHEARRIDNQLRGRAGRQGDKGSSQFFLCFDDDLMRLFAPEWTVKALAWIGWEEGQPIYHGRISKGIEKAQKKVEERNFEQRKSLLDYDEVMDYQRKIFYKRRRQLLRGEGLKSLIMEMIERQIDTGSANMLSEEYRWNCAVEWARSQFGVDLAVRDIEGSKPEEIEEVIKELAKKNVANEISLSLGEYLEDYSDKATWKVDSLCKWAMSKFDANLSANKLRDMEVEDIERSVIDAACAQVENQDYSQLGEFLEEGFGVRLFAQWVGSKFDIKVDVEELEGLKADEVKAKLNERVAEKYEQREIEYPVEFAMNMVFGGAEVNIYGFEKLAEWANKRYGCELEAEKLGEMKPKEIYEMLVEYSDSYHKGRLEEEINGKIDGGADASEVAAWAKERFDADVDVDEQTSIEAIREKVLEAGRGFLRKELTDLEKYVLLQIYDGTWKDHLYSMDHLKESIFLRAFAEKDPKIEYKREGFRMFNEMLEQIEDKVTDVILKVRLTPKTQQRRSVWNVSNTSHDSVGQFSMAQKQRAAAQAPQGEVKVKTIVTDERKVGRNEPCPCGSGKKYKKCCGRG